MRQSPGAAVVLGALGPGGAERIMVRLACLLSRHMPIDIVVPSPQPDAMKASIDPGVTLVELEAGHYYGALRLFNKIFKTKDILLFPWACVVFVWKLCASTWALRGYIRRTRPRALLTAHYDTITIIANYLAGRPSRVIVTGHTMLSEHLARQPSPVRYCFSWMCRLFYPLADRVVGVSKAVMQDVIENFRVPASRATYIYNPVVGPALAVQSEEACRHPWIGCGVPVLASVARLSPEKDIMTLLDAFALLREERECRLLVLGDGPDRDALVSRARELGIDEDIDWLGMVSDPLPYVRGADVMVLSTFYEGLPTVLIEALFVGTTPVASDAPGGIRELLDDGRYGYLAPVHDPRALAAAILEAWDRPIAEDVLKARAEEFSEDEGVGAYLSLLHDLEAIDP